jgi:predicted PurR-regulated permease PerM
MTVIEGITGSIIATIIVAIAIAVYKRWFGQQIKITDPRPHGDFGMGEIRGR